MDRQSFEDHCDELLLSARRNKESFRRTELLDVPTSAKAPGSTPREEHR